MFTRQNSSPAPPATDDGTSKLIKRLKCHLLDGTPVMQTMFDGAEEIMRLRFVLRRIMTAQGTEASVAKFKRIADNGLRGE